MGYCVRFLSMMRMAGQGEREREGKGREEGLIFS